MKKLLLISFLFINLISSGQDYLDWIETVSGCKEYGLLYNWYAASDTNITSGNGWIVPDTTDYQILLEYLGDYDEINYSAELVGGYLKYTGLEYWDSPNDGATNQFNFNATGSGIRINSGEFTELKQSFEFALLSFYDALSVYTALLLYDTSTASFDIKDTGVGTSIRLLRPATVEEQLLDDGAYVDNYVGNDSTEYLAVKIGTQVWLAQNLRETLFRTGVVIPFRGSDNDSTFTTLEWSELVTAGVCAYEDSLELVACGFELPPLALELTWDDILNVPVADATSVSDWNTFFDLPTNGNQFTSVEIITNTVYLIGGSEIIIKESLFDDINEYGVHLISIIDNADCVVEIGNGAFGAINYQGCPNLTTVILDAVITVGDGVFGACISLVSASLSSATYLGSDCFNNCLVLQSLNLNSIETINDSSIQDCQSIEILNLQSLLHANGGACFASCFNLTTIYLNNLINLGTTVGYDSVFKDITGQTITLIVPSTLTTCNGGSPDGDIQYLQANNTVTILNP